jgi:prenyltransferase beta subunit
VRLLAATLALGALLAASATAAPNAANQARLDRTVRYLQDAQQANGGFGKAGEPSQVASAWTTLALAAAGINPQDQAKPGGADAYAFLVSHYRQGVEESDCAPIACTTTLERELMVVNAAGTSAHDFGGVDLAGELLARAQPDGSFPHEPSGQAGVNDTIFAVFALVPVEEPGAQATVQRAADWVEAAQQAGGGWSAMDRDGPDEVDMTGAAIQALVAAGRGGTAAVLEGVAYLRKAQNSDGGFPEFPGNPESNVASTAWAVQAIWAAGQDPETWVVAGGAEPLAYMASLQQPDGRVRWKASQDLNGVWMTAYVTPAFAGQVWPFPTVPRAVKPPMSPPGPGEGDGSQSGAGVIAGGGGKGAPLFSRPKPQSRGRTPGGVRVLRERRSDTRNHGQTRRGENTEQPTGTAASAARGLDSRRLHPDPSPSSAGGDGGDAGGSALTGAGAQGGGGREVTGTLVGGGSAALGAPGLHGAGVDGGETPTVAIAIGAAALLLGLGGSRLERRQMEAL